MEPKFKTKKELMIAHTELSADLAKLSSLASYSDSYDGKLGDGVANCISALVDLAISMDKRLFWPVKGEFTRMAVTQLAETLRGLKGALKALSYMVDPIGEPCATFYFLNEFMDIRNEAEHLAEDILAVYDTYPAIDRLTAMPDGFEA